VSISACCWGGSRHVQHFLIFFPINFARSRSRKEIFVLPGVREACTKVAWYHQPPLTSSCCRNRRCCCYHRRRCCCYHRCRRRWEVQPHEDGRRRRASTWTTPTNRRRSWLRWSTQSGGPPTRHTPAILPHNEPLNKISLQSHCPNVSLRANQYEIRPHKRAPLPPCVAEVIEALRTTSHDKIERQWQKKPRETSGVVSPLADRQPDPQYMITLFPLLPSMPVFGPARTPRSQSQAVLLATIRHTIRQVCLCQLSTLLQCSRDNAAPSQKRCKKGIWDGKQEVERNALTSLASGMKVSSDDVIGCEAFAIIAPHLPPDVGPRACRVQGTVLRTNRFSACSIHPRKHGPIFPNPHPTTVQPSPTHTRQLII
jgi:hypothetical protein